MLWRGLTEGILSVAYFQNLILSCRFLQNHLPHPMLNVRCVFENSVIEEVCVRDGEYECVRWIERENVCVALVASGLCFFFVFCRR